jgi:hypothetical protein
MSDEPDPLSRSRSARDRSRRSTSLAARAPQTCRLMQASVYPVLSLLFGTHACSCSAAALHGNILKSHQYDAANHASARRARMPMLSRHLSLWNGYFRSQLAETDKRWK